MSMVTILAGAAIVLLVCGMIVAAIVVGLRNR